MFDEVNGLLSYSKDTFSQKVKDSFGSSLVRDVYEPLEATLGKARLAWQEAEIKKAEIMALLIELRTIL